MQIEPNSPLLAAVEAAMVSGDLALAERLCLEVDPTDIRARRLLGIIAARKGDSERAIVVLEEVAASRKDDLEAIYWLAVSKRGLKRFQEAAENFRRAASLAPTNAAIYHDLGLCLAASLDFGGAIAAFKRAIELQPNSAPLMHSLGSAYQSVGAYKEAAEAFNAAVAIAPYDIHAYIAMAHLGLDGNDKKSAQWFFRKAFEMEPSSFRGQVQLGHALVLEHQFSEAEELLARLIRMKPNASTPYGLLAAVLHNLGRFDEANELTKKAIGLDPLKTGYYTQYVGQRKFTEADRPFIETMKAVVDDPRIGPLGAKELHFAIGKVLNDLNDYEEAMEAFDKGNELAYNHLPSEMRLDRDEYVGSIDRLMAFYTPERIEYESATVGSFSNRPIFIVGMPRSGTTLLDQILSSHPKVGSAGELTYWRVKAREALRHDGSYSFSLPVAYEYLELLSSHDAISERVIDKMPPNYVNLGMIRAYFPEARILHSKRHPIDNCISMYTTPGLADDFVHRKEDIVFLYEQYRRMMEYWTNIIPADQMMTVQYEDVLKDPETVIRGVLSFCGLEWDPACLEHDKNAKAIATPSAWQARQPIYKTSMERWRNYEPWLGPFAKLAP